jgi:hypothetical protein
VYRSSEFRRKIGRNSDGLSHGRSPEYPGNIFALQNRGITSPAHSHTEDDLADLLVRLEKSGRLLDLIEPEDPRDYWVERAGSKSIVDEGLCIFSVSSR